MKTHKLKTVNPFFQNLWEERKTFEIRIDDRGYEVGDTLILEEFDPITDTKSGREISVTVPYLLRGEPYLPMGYVCMSIRILSKRWRD